MSLKILIVDDEPDILELLCEELELEGFIIKTCLSGNQAVSILEEESFDVVLSDYKMPDGNGRVVLDFVKSLPANNRPVFYFVSGQADISFEDALNEGVKKFFYKPFSIDELISSLKDESIKNA